VERDILEHKEGRFGTQRGTFWNIKRDILEHA